MIVAGIDIETPGGGHAACEFTVVAIHSVAEDWYFEVTPLVDSGPVTLDLYAMRVHGITPSMICGKPRIRQVWSDFRSK